MTYSALLTVFESETAWERWITDADKAAGLPSDNGTITLTYPIRKDGKIYCFIPETCPKEALPTTAYTVDSIVLDEKGIKSVALVPLSRAAREAFELLSDEVAEKLEEQANSLLP